MFKIIVEIKKHPDNEGNCECVEVQLTEEDIFDLAIMRSEMLKINVFDIEIDCIKI